MRTPLAHCVVAAATIALLALLIATPNAPTEAKPIEAQSTAQSPAQSTAKPAAQPTTQPTTQTATPTAAQNAASPAANNPTLETIDLPVTVPVAAEKPDDGKLRIIAFGGHPDDCEIRLGGAAMLWAARGHKVKFVSCTNGDIGHWASSGGALAQRRLREVKAAAKIFGIETEVLDIHDGELMPDLETRRRVTRLIREWKADLVLCHRPNDYHPDHRNTGLVVQDAAYMVTVPYFCPDTPYLSKNPVFMYYWDRFKKPAPFEPDVAINIDPAIEKKLAALVGMESQFVEGGCCAQEKKMPADRPAAHKRVAAYFSARFQHAANEYRDGLIKWYGPDKADTVKHAEAFEVSEYGSQPSREELKQLFPF